jgi:hypothetical protein
MTYDPFQTYSAIGAGVTNPLQSPYMAASQINPIALQQLAATAGIGGAGIVPQHLQHQLHQQQLQQLQQLQLAQILAARAGIPQLMAGSPWTNPLAAGFENPLMNPLVAQQFGGQQGFPTNPYQVNPYQVNPYQHTPQMGFGPLGQGLAPQSWVGQPGQFGSQIPGQVHPLVAQQLAARGFCGTGFSPWGF